MMNNNRDVNYLHNLQQKLHFMTLCREKVLNFWGKCHAKIVAIKIIDA